MMHVCNTLLEVAAALILENSYLKYKVIYYNKKLMKKMILLYVLFLLSITIQAQTFVCTDINYYGPNYNPTSIQKNKARYLGSKATLAFYDKNLKISYSEKGKTKSFVLDKVNDNEYHFYEKDLLGNVTKGVIKLQKWAAYIKSFTLESYKNNTLEVYATFKRD